MKRTRVVSPVVVVAVVAVAGRALVAQQKPAEPKVAAIEKVKDNLYMVTGGGGNTAVFVTANGVVLVPTFNDANDRIALNTLAELMPSRRVVGIHAVDLVWGLGTLHCLTQQEPMGQSR